VELNVQQPTLNAQRPSEASSRILLALSFCAYPAEPPPAGTAMGRVRVGTAEAEAMRVDSEPSHDHIEGLVGVGGDILGEGVDIGGVRGFIEEEEQAVA